MIAARCHWIHRPFLLLPLLLLFCLPPDAITQTPKPLSGDLIIFHAGSLSVPFAAIAAAFMQEHPRVTVKRESAGSVASARKITDLHRPCDILASADYTVIDNLLIPTYTDQNIKFATNEMVIAFTPTSTDAGTINAGNWFRILKRPAVRYGRSDPNSDPCGYRTVMTLRLANTYYDQPHLSSTLLAKDNRYMRPKEVDLLALLESHTIDYIFIYKSVALQHELQYITLPDEINLKNPALADHYHTVTVQINGKKPGEQITLHGEPMVYSITILHNAPNKPAAEAFLQFLLDPAKGGTIMRENGQEPR